MRPSGDIDGWRARDRLLAREREDPDARSGSLLLFAATAKRHSQLTAAPRFAGKGRPLRKVGKLCAPLQSHQIAREVFGVNTGEAQLGGGECWQFNKAEYCFREGPTQVRRALQEFLLRYPAWSQ